MRWGVLPAIGWFLLVDFTNKQRMNLAYCTYLHWRNARFFLPFLKLFPYTYFISYLCSANPTQIQILLLIIINIINFFFFQHSIHIDNDVSNKYNSIVEKSIDFSTSKKFVYLLHLTQMIDSQNSLEQKKYFFHLMDKFMEKFRIRGVVAYSFLHLSIVEYYYMDPAIRCILV